MWLARLLLSALPAHAEAVSWPEPPVVQDLALVAESQEGDLWVATDLGVWVRPQGGAGWTRFGEAEGLPSGGTPTALVADGDGRVWVGTDRGAVRVATRGGVPVTTVTLAGPCAVTTIVPAGPEVWLRCRDRSLARHYDGHTWTEDPSPPRASVRAADGAWWVAQGSGVRRRELTGSWGPEVALGIHAEVLAAGEDGLWAAEGRSLVHLPRGSAPHALPLPTPALSLASRPGGGVWVGSEAGRVWMGGEDGGEVLPSPLDLRIEQVVPGQDGSVVWLARGGAVERDASGVLHVLPDGPLHGLGPYAAKAEAAVVLADGSLWGARADGAIARFGPDGVTEEIPALREPGLARLFVAGHTTWALAGGHGAVVRREADGSWRRIGVAPGASVVTSDGAGAVWVVGGQGAWRVDGDRLAHVGWLPRTHGASTAPDGLWLLTDEGIGHLDTGGVFTVRVPLPSLPGPFRSLASSVTAATDRAGRVWWGVEDDGLFRFDPATGAVTALGPDRVVALDREGTVWSGGVQGLSRWGLTGERPTRQVQGVNLTSLAFDGAGHAWGASWGTLVRLDDGGRWAEVARGPGSPSADADGGIWWSGSRLDARGGVEGPPRSSRECQGPREAPGWLSVGAALFRVGGAPVGLAHPWPRATICALATVGDTLWMGLGGGAIARLGPRGWSSWRLAVGIEPPQVGIGWDGQVWATAGAGNRYLFEQEQWRRVATDLTSGGDAAASSPTPAPHDAFAPWVDDGLGQRWVLSRGWLWRVVRGELTAVVPAEGTHLVADPAGGVWIGGGTLRREGSPGGVIDATEHIPGDRVEGLAYVDGRLWIRGRTGVVTAAPPWDAWTRDGAPYHNDRRADPTITVEREGDGHHPGPWQPVAGLPSGAPSGVQTTDDVVVVTIDGLSYRLSTQDWATVSGRLPVRTDPPPAPEPDRTARSSAAFEQATLFASGDGGGREGAPQRPGTDDNGASDAEKRRAEPGGDARVGDLGPFAAPAPRPPATGAASASWVQGLPAATLSDRVAAFVIDGRTVGRPDLPLAPLDGAAEADAWWLLLEDGRLLSGEGGRVAPPEPVPVATPMALTRAGGVLCVGGETLACRDDGGPWREVAGVTGVLRLVGDGGRRWALTPREVCRVDVPVVCTPAPDVRDLVPDGLGGAWLLTAEGLASLSDGTITRRLAGDWTRLSRGPDGTLALGGAALTTWNPATGDRTDVELPGPARAVHHGPEGRVEVRIGDTRWR